MTEDRKIYPTHEAFYIQSIKFNISSAINSYDTVESEFKKNQVNQTLILDNLQNIIIQAAGVSKYFWPVRKQHTWRGKQLRNAFDIKENNPLKSRSLRNSIEHFDERLDNYLDKFVSGIVLPEYFGPSLSGKGPTAHLFRAYFFDKGIFQLLDEAYEIRPILKEIFKIHDMLIDLEKDGYRLPKNN